MKRIFPAGAPRHLQALLYSALQLSVPPAVRARHYRRNLEVLRRMPAGPVEDQHAHFWDHVHYGALPASGNFCGPAAVYNACLLLGLSPGPARLAALLRQFERRGIALLGYAGTAPSALRRYFQDRGYRTLSLYGDDAVRPGAFTRHFRIFLVTVFKDRTCIRKGLHTVCISAGPGGFRIHNPGQGICPADAVFPSLREAVRHAGYEASSGTPRSGALAVTGICREDHRICPAPEKELKS